MRARDLATLAAAAPCLALRSALRLVLPVTQTVRGWAQP